MIFLIHKNSNLDSITCENIIEYSRFILQSSDYLLLIRRFNFTYNKPDNVTDITISHMYNINITNKKKIIKMNKMLFNIHPININRMILPK